MKELIERIVQYASSDYARVMRDILTDRAGSWGVVSGELGEINWPNFKAYLAGNPEAAQRYVGFVAAVENRLRANGQDPEKASDVALTGAENNIRTQMLRDKLAATGFTEVSGVWGGLPEKSFFIPSISHAAIKALADEFGQQAYIYGVSKDDTGAPHYWLMERATGSVWQDGNPNEDMKHLGGDSRENMKSLKKKQMESGEPVTRPIPDKDIDRSEVGLRRFRLDRSPKTTGTPPPPVAGPEEPKKFAGYYYCLKHDFAKYIGRDSVYRIGGISAFFPNGIPNAKAMRVLIPLSQDEVNRLAPPMGGIKRI